MAANQPGWHARCHVMKVPECKASELEFYFSWNSILLVLTNVVGAVLMPHLPHNTTILI